MRERRRQPRRNQIRMDREHVHDRPRALRGAVGRAEILMNRVGECVWPGQPGLSWPCDASAPPMTFTSSGDELERVVRPREQQLVGARREIDAAHPELRHPEQVEIRFVADDEVADRRELLRDRRRVRGELTARTRRQRHGSPVARVDRDDQAHAVELRRRGRVPQHDFVVAADRCSPGCHEDRHPYGVEPGERCHVHLRLRDHRIEAATLSSVAPTNMPVPRGPTRGHNATRTAQQHEPAHAGGYSSAMYSGSTVGPNKDLDEFAVGGRDPACAEPFRHRVRRPARGRRQRRQLATLPGFVVSTVPRRVASEPEQGRGIALDLGGNGARRRCDIVVRADSHELVRYERLLPRVLEGLRQLERLTVGSDLRRDRRPDAGRDRLARRVTGGHRRAR